MHLYNYKGHLYIKDTYTGSTIIIEAEFSKRSHVAIIKKLISSPIEDLFYKLLLVYMASITILWESELITLLPTHTSLAQYCLIDPKVQPATWLLLENPITYRGFTLLGQLKTTFCRVPILFCQARFHCVEETSILLLLLLRTAFCKVQIEVIFNCLICLFFLTPNTSR